LQLHHLGGLVFREHLGENFIDTQVATDGLGDLACVTRDHDDLAAK
jgi:hypothetical protein